MFAVLFGGLITFLRVSMVALFGSWKAVLLTSLVAFGAIAIYNVFVELLETMLNFAVSLYGTAEAPTGSQTLFQFTGLLGYFLSCFKIPECVAFIISMITIKFIMRKVPFLRW